MATVSLSPSAWTAGFGAADLNALANTALAVSSLGVPQIDNTAGGNLFVQFEVSLAALSPATNASLLVFLVPESTTPGTYMAGSSGTVANDHYKWQNGPYGIISLRLTAGAAQIQRSALIQIGPERYIIGVINRSGVALASTGNQILWRTCAELVA